MYMHVFLYYELISKSYLNRELVSRNTTTDATFTTVHKAQAQVRIVHSLQTRCITIQKNASTVQLYLCVQVRSLVVATYRFISALFSRDISDVISKLHTNFLFGMVLEIAYYIDCNKGVTLRVFFWYVNGIAVECTCMEVAYLCKQIHGTYITQPCTILSFLMVLQYVRTCKASNNCR